MWYVIAEFGGFGIIFLISWLVGKRFHKNHPMEW